MRKPRFRVVVTSPGTLFHDGKWGVFIMEHDKILSSSAYATKKQASRAAHYLKGRTKKTLVEIM